MKHVRRAPKGAGKIGGDDREDQGGIDAPCSAHIKIAKREPANLQVAQDIAADKIAGNNEEHVDADEPAFEAADLEVKQHNADDGNGPQSADLGSKMACHKYQSARRREPRDRSLPWA